MLGSDAGVQAVCRNIETPFDLEPPATEVEMRDASLQLAGKRGGFKTPSRANDASGRADGQLAASARRSTRSLPLRALRLG